MLKHLKRKCHKAGKPSNGRGTIKKASSNVPHLSRQWHCSMYNSEITSGRNINLRYYGRQSCRQHMHLQTNLHEGRRFWRNLIYRNVTAVINQNSQKLKMHLHAASLAFKSERLIWNSANEKKMFRSMLNLFLNMFTNQV